MKMKPKRLKLQKKKSEDLLKREIVTLRKSKKLIKRMKMQRMKIKVNSGMISAVCATRVDISFAVRLVHMWSTWLVLD